MEYEIKNLYESVSPGTMGVAQKISAGYQLDKSAESKETSKLVFLAKNEVISCGHNQY